jgi:nitroreductase
MSEVIEALRERRARRSFDARPVEPEVLASLWEAVSLAPSHGNNQPVRALCAVSAPVREAVLAALSDGNRAWAGAAPVLAAIAAIPEHDTAAPNRDGTTRELWPFHAGIATGNLLAQGTALGLVVHPMAGFDEAAVREAFGAPPAVRVLAVVAIGYPGPVEALPADLQRRETAPQRRLPIENLVALDRWRPENGISWKELRDRDAPR